MARVDHLGNLGKLSVAILQSQVKKLIGDEAVDALREPLEEKNYRMP